MDKIRNIIASACLKHSDSGLASFDREARVILQALSDNGYTIVKQLNPVDVNTKWNAKIVDGLELIPKRQTKHLL